jgi:hypothetical protein
LFLARLSQQLADFNKDWEPEWFDDDKTKFCIVNDFRGGCGEFKVVQRTTLYRFLAFKTKEDAATNNFRVFVYIVTTYFIFTIPISILLYKLNLKSVLN